MADDDAARLRALEAKLAARRPKPATDHRDESYSQAQLAWRMVIELVAGLGIGFGIGYGLDVLLGTSPWLMVVFVLLGFAAGVKTMVGSAREMQGRLDVAGTLAEPGAGVPDDDPDDDDDRHDGRR